MRHAQNRLHNFYRDLRTSENNEHWHPREPTGVVCCPAVGGRRQTDGRTLAPLYGRHSQLPPSGRSAVPPLAGRGYQCITVTGDSSSFLVDSAQIKVLKPHSPAAPHPPPGNHSPVPKLTVTLSSSGQRGSFDEGIEKHPSLEHESRPGRSPLAVVKGQRGQPSDLALGGGLFEPFLLPKGRQQPAPVEAWNEYEAVLRMTQALPLLR